jgi:hypothetical protein
MRILLRMILLILTDDKYHRIENNSDTKYE